MQSVLLKSGNIKNYTPLGQDGTPVYKIAAPFRNTIKFQITPEGQKFADYLAIPQLDEYGDNFDWYIPFDSTKSDGSYTVIPWKSASLEDRQKAYEELHAFEERMFKFGFDLQHQGNAQGDMLLFSRLLYDQKKDEFPDSGNPNNLTALRFPNSDHVFLVNGRPVITFWGFNEKNATIHGQPFISLKEPTPTSPVAPSVAPTVPLSTPTPPLVPPPPTSRPSCLGRLFLPFFSFELGSCLWRIFWSVISLGILGLLSLLFLRGCTNIKLPDLGLPDFGLSNSAKVDTPITKERCLNNQHYLFENDQWVNTDTKTPVTDSTQITLLENLPEDSIKQCDTVADTHHSSATETIPEVADQNPTDTEAIPPADKPALADDETSAEDSLPSDENQSPSDGNTPTSDNDENQGTPPSENDTGNTGNPPPELPNTDTRQNTPAGTTTTVDKTALSIPETSLKDGNLDFLNGQWTANSGLQDKASGKPIQLNYDFKNGKGQVQIKRSDGVLCNGNVDATMQKGSLNINKGIANCSDHSAYKLPQVRCKPDKNGRTDCQGVYNKGEQFPMTMKAKH